ncbi:MAG: tRNA (adenosine(37)-N6)-dimethylallyltransferase MiaA [Bacteroidales bacterium]|nr:tRNA (adenosine(37)-N6)-dimethylallyltransferase MiaA [Bacteroidales bacterium]
MPTDNASSYNLITVLGPTASGKTSFAANLANRLNGEIISADSRQVYRNMNLGTGKDYNDYIVNGTPVPYHLIDIVEPGYKYNVFEFQRDFVRTFYDVRSRSRLPLLCGGSGLYLNAAIKGYRLIPVPPNEKLREELSVKSLDELTEMLASIRKLHNLTDIDTKARAIRAIEIERYHQDHAELGNEYPSIRNLCLGIQFIRFTERRRITERLHKRLASGMIEEVKALLHQGMTAESLVYYGLEYKYITHYLTGKLNYESMVEQLNIAIHQFAKRQMTWFRKMEREGTIIHWISGELTLEEKLEIAMELFKNIPAA